MVVGWKGVGVLLVMGWLLGPSFFTPNHPNSTTPRPLPPCSCLAGVDVVKSGPLLVVIVDGVGSKGWGESNNSPSYPQ